MRILHTNDMHGTLSEARFRALIPHRQSADLYFDTGDAIRAGNLAIPLRPEAVWPYLAQLNCTASVLGNRETHVVESGFRAKLAGHAHPILCANLRDIDGTFPLARTLEFSVGDIKVGLIGVMVPMVTDGMKTAIASRYRWDPPLITAALLSEELRPRVDLLIALTHIGHRQDQELAKFCPSIDLIFGGHSHTVLMEPERIGKVSICQGGSHCRFIGEYEWTPDSGLTGGLVPFPDDGTA